jgi:conjugal transfer/entry exclusion protein
MNATTNIETQAIIDSLTNDIDRLFIIDNQAKDLAKQVKTMKDAIANKYGESAKDADGKYIPFQGEQHQVTVQLVSVKGNVDYAALCAAYKITDEVLNTYRAASRADIKVCPSK